MRLAFVITGLGTGGAEMMLLKILERLNPKYKPLVISLTTLGEIGERIQALGIPVKVLGMRPGLSGLCAFLHLVRELAAIRPDVVNTWMYHADLLGGLAARLAGVRAVAWCIRNTNLDTDKIRRRTRLVVTLCARTSAWLPKAIVTNSQAASDMHKAIGYASDKIVVVPNGFDLARFVPDADARRSVREELRVPPGTLLVGLIGRFHPHKNQRGFLQAAGLVHRMMPEVHFLLAGKGVEQANSALTKIVGEQGISGRVHLLGLRDDIPRLMAALDVLASSSDGEAFPNVLGEAMACRVPCVVTDVGDCAYIVGNTGRVVKPGDACGLAAAINTLLRLPPAERLLLGKHARTRVAQHFEIGQIVRRYEAIYDNLAGGERCHEGRA